MRQSTWTRCWQPCHGEVQPYAFASFATLLLEIRRLPSSIGAPDANQREGGDRRVHRDHQSGVARRHGDRPGGRVEDDGPRFQGPVRIEQVRRREYLGIVMVSAIIVSAHGATQAAAASEHGRVRQQNLRSDRGIVGCNSACIFTLTRYPTSLIISWLSGAQQSGRSQANQHAHIGEQRMPGRQGKGSQFTKIEFALTQTGADDMRATCEV